MFKMGFFTLQKTENGIQNTESGICGYFAFFKAQYDNMDFLLVLLTQDDKSLVIKYPLANFALR